MKFSESEVALLREIQRDSSLSLAELASRCGMAQSTVWRKLQEFDSNGMIRGRVALIDPTKAGCRLTVLVSISLSDRSEKALDEFAKLIHQHTEIVECFAVSGSFDYLLKVRVEDVEAYESFMTNHLLSIPQVRDVHSSFVLKDLKSTTEIPLR